MKIQAEVILNLKRDGATSTLLILDEEVYILLDCGLNANLDFSAYYDKLELLSKVEIILLSHVGSEYVGALPFLLNTR
jgi:Cft2 family RNA processing exonuclease